MHTSTQTRIAASGSTTAPIARSIARVHPRRRTKTSAWAASSTLSSGSAAIIPYAFLGELVGVLFERGPRLRAERLFPAFVVLRFDQLLPEAVLVAVVERHPAPRQLVAHRLAQQHRVVAGRERRLGHLARDHVLVLLAELVPNVLVHQRPVARPDVIGHRDVLLD